ncbi:MAG: hypothetical protein QNI84_10580 [Henriciella sp.]|nr:hypothetical protein [Henriciella sp.]
MTDQNDTPPHALIMGLLSDEDERSDIAALRLVRQFANRCTSILINDQNFSANGGRALGQLTRAESRRQHLLSLAEKLDMELDVIVAEMRDSLEKLRSSAKNDLVILNQPAQALDRQTFVFRRMERALIELPNPVLYAPSGAASKNREIIVLSSAADSQVVSVTDRLAKSGGQIVNYQISSLSDVSHPDSELRLKLQSDSPDLIVVDAGDLPQPEKPYSRLAAVLNIPVLVVSERQ